MHNDRFDHSIRSKLEKHPTTIDTDNLWDRIDTKRNMPPSDKRRLLWVLPLLLLTIGMAGGLFFYKTNSSSANENNPTAENNISTENIQPPISNKTKIKDNKTAKIKELKSTKRTSPIKTKKQVFFSEKTKTNHWEKDRKIKPIFQKKIEK